MISRLAGRRVCRDCQAMYHVEFTPPKVEGKCDKCGGELYRRADDEPETVRNRLFVYYKQTAPLIGYYYAHGVLVSLDGDRADRAGAGRSAGDAVRAAAQARSQDDRSEVAGRDRARCARRAGSWPACTRRCGR